MKHTEFFAALKKGEIAPCYLFEGEEEFTKRSALSLLRERVAGGDFAAMNDTRLVDPAPDALIAERPDRRRSGSVRGIPVAGQCRYAGIMLAMARSVLLLSRPC